MISSINSQLRSKTSELSAKSDQLLAVITEVAGNAAVSSQTASEAAGKAQLKADSADASAVRIGNLEAQLRSDIDMDELRLAASASRHTLWPLLLSRLAGLPPANATIELPFLASDDTKMFAEKLLVALEGFKWEISSSPPRGGKDGITIFNKWYSGTVGRIRPDPVSNEVDGEYITEAKRRLVGLPGNIHSVDMSEQEASRLSILALALDATLEKDARLGRNSLRIVIGNPVSASNK